MPLSRDARLSVSDAFLPRYQRTAADELQAVRRLTLWRAADFVLGKDAENWLELRWVLWRQRRGFIGARDEAGLVAVLRELDTMRCAAVLSAIS